MNLSAQIPRHIARVSLIIVASMVGTVLSADQLTVTTDGNTIWWNTAPGYCCVTVSLDNEQPSTHCSVTACENAAGKSGQFGCNRVGTHVVKACMHVPDSTEKICESKTITVTEPPPPGCPLFTLTALGSKVLTHKYQTSDTYPSGQSRDAQMEVQIKPIRVETGTTLYLRVIDPADPSTYRSDPEPNDNHDTAAGRVALSPSDSGGKTLQFTVPDGPGVVPLYLNTTGFAAGDNYIVQASADPQVVENPEYVCGPTCQQTPTITAWKRIYLEKKRMFRSGAFVVGTAQAGQNQVTVEIPDDARVRFRPGDALRLVHAPPLHGGELFPLFYSEDVIIAAHGVDRVQGANNRRVLTMTTPLQHTYRQEDESVQNAMALGVGDGVGILAAGFYETNDAYVAQAFGRAFVEFQNIATRVAEIPLLPFLPMVREEFISNKWFEHSPVLGRVRPGDENVKHVLGGTGWRDGNKIDVARLGVTGSGITHDVSSPNFSWTFVRAIEAAVQHGTAVTGFDAWIVNGENVVHELAHVFNVNAFGAERWHCSADMATDSTKSCTMNRDTNRGDGVVGFHWISDTDSEYMTIRRTFEPVPSP